MAELPSCADNLSLRVDVDSRLRAFPRVVDPVRGARAGVRCFLLFAAWAFFLYFVRAIPSSNAGDGAAIRLPTRKVEGGGSFAVVHCS